MMMMLLLFCHLCAHTDDDSIAMMCRYAWYKNWRFITIESLPIYTQIRSIGWRTRTEILHHKLKLMIVNDRDATDRQNRKSRILIKLFFFLSLYMSLNSFIRRNKTSRKTAIDYDDDVFCLSVCECVYDVDVSLNAFRTICYCLGIVVVVLQLDFVNNSNKWRWTAEQMISFTQWTHNAIYHHSAWLRNATADDGMESRENKEINEQKKQMKKGRGVFNLSVIHSGESEHHCLK